MKVVGLEIRARKRAAKIFTCHALSLAHAREDTDLLYLLVSREEILAMILYYLCSSSFLPPGNPGNWKTVVAESVNFQ